MTKALEKPSPEIISQWTEIEQMTTDDLVKLLDEIIDEMKVRKWKDESTE